MTAEAGDLGADSSEDEILQNKSSQLNADSSDDEIKNTGSQLNADSSDEDLPVKRLSNANINANSSDEGETQESRAKALQSSDDEEISAGSSRRKGKKKTFITSDGSGSDTEEQNEVTERKNASSSEDETPKSSPGGRKKKKITMRKAAGSDEDSDGSQSQSKSQVSTLLKNKDLYDAESSDEELPDIPSNSRQEESKGSGSEEEDEEVEEETESLDTIKNRVMEKHKKGSERKSAQAAMMEIRSESARMTRESAIGLPYHRPKQRSLDEFLNRKKGTPEVLKSINLKRFDTSIERVMEERQNKIKDFFKADSDEENAADDEEDEDDKDYNPAAPEDDQTVKDVNTETSTDLPEPEVAQVTSASEETSQEEMEESTPPSPGAQISSEVPESNEKESIDTNDSGDSLRLELAPETEVMEVAEVVAPAEEESLKLVLETESLAEVEDEVIPSSPAKPVSQAWARLQALKNKIGDSSNLEDTIQVTPKIGTNPDNDELVICEAGSEKNVSKGAQELIEKFISHAKAGSDRPEAATPEVENVKIVSKKTVDGREVLMEEIVEYKKDESSQKQLLAGASYTTYKAKLKKEMMAKKRVQVEQKREILKINNEEGFEDELPEDEIAEDEEYEYDDEEEGESEPEEEDDVVYKDKKRKKSHYIDDEAEDEDEDDGDEAGDAESDENESITFEESSLKKSQFRKIIADPELMSETSNQSDSVFGRLERIRCDSETPTLNTSAKQTSAPSSNSSFGTFVLAEPRWTPFQDRTNHGSLVDPDNTLSVLSPTQSQMAKKKLGFEGLFDATDPDVTGIDDVIGLCSGQFATQSQAPAPGQTQVMETQDTVILSGTGDSRPVSRAEANLDTQEDTVIVAGTQPDLQLNASINNILQDLDKDDDNVGHGVIQSDEEEDQPEVDQMLKISKKRKGRLLSDSEESEDDDHSEKKEDEGENDEPGEKDYDSEEKEISKPKAAKQKLFTKKGKLRQDFYDIEAELSDEEGGGLGVSDDEDEKDLDRLEMEDGDLDDIDETEEMEKVGRIHQRVLLDEDQANLKLFQERFLEDGDLHTDYKRQRQFKWNDLDEDIEVERLEEVRCKDHVGNIFLCSGWSQERRGGHRGGGGDSGAVAAR